MCTDEKTELANRYFVFPAMDDFQVSSIFSSISHMKFTFFLSYEPAYLQVCLRYATFKCQSKLVQFSYLEPIILYIL